ncbi:hypothetical protein [uncultured Photobacterium sp.]|uniref:hypothetical protein n=1 Tax=uncultured Photobacterium sp. TaxID=173973 RepID=UPI00260CEC02|nr:hypothetical protein [uncultured Photobacterium sp.]
MDFKNCDKLQNVMQIYRFDTLTRKHAENIVKANEIGILVPVRDTVVTVVDNNDKDHTISPV